MDFLYVTPLFFNAKDMFPNLSFIDGETHMVQFTKILVIVCRQSKYKFLIPVNTNITSRQVVEIMDRFIFPTTG